MPPGLFGKVQEGNLIRLFLIGQADSYLQEILRCPPLRVAEEEGLDGLDRRRDPAVETDKAEITDVVSHAQIFEQEMMKIVEV